jgi:hypothetical protein
MRWKMADTRVERWSDERLRESWRELLWRASAQGYTCAEDMVPADLEWYLALRREADRRGCQLQLL